MDKKLIKKLVAQLVVSAGCGCCRDDDNWGDAKNELGKLLRVKKFDDGSGYDFYSINEKRP